MRRIRTLVVLLAFALIVTGQGASQPAQAALSPATIWSSPISPFTYVGYGFGTYVGGCGGAPKRHTGRDLRASVGQQIRAAANGRIYGVFYEGGVGYTTLVEHSVPYEGTVISRYSHVVPRSGYGAGRLVSRGEVIATIYNLGSNTHFAFNVYAHSYELWAWRGYLPSKPCGGDPAFPGRFVDPVRYLVVHSDTRAPATHVAPRPTIAAHRGGWTRGSWAVTFSCFDDKAGCLGTQYRLDGGPITTAPKTLALGKEGRRTLYYRSIDRHHNVEAWRGPLVLNVDRGAPTVQLDSAAPAFASSEFVELTATTSDPATGSPLVASGVHAVRFVFCSPNASSAGANCHVANGARTSTGWSGKPGTELAPGPYEAWAIAEDWVGNVTPSAHAVFTVLASSPTGN